MSELEIRRGGRLAYRRIAGRAPGVMFLGGFMSNMTGRKASALQSHCAMQGRAFVCFDYRGHGVSPGDMQALGFDSWLEDSLTVLDTLTEGPQILVGSSMGAWLMTRCLEERADRVAAALGLGAAADFTDAALERLDAAQRASLETRGFCEQPTVYADAPYVLTRRLIDSGRAHSVLSRHIEFKGPVRLLHGLADADVPWQRSVALAGALRSPDLEVRLIGGGDHRLSEPRDLTRLCAVLEELVAAVERGSWGP